MTAMVLHWFSQIVHTTSAFLKKLTHLTIIRKFGSQSTIGAKRQLSLFRQKSKRRLTRGIVILLLTFSFSLFTSNLLGVAYVIALPQKPFVGYFESWSKNGTTELANLAPYVNVVIVSFMNPAGTYISKSYDLTKTGLSFNASGTAVKDAIVSLKRKNPGTKVLLGVGGDTYKDCFYNTKNNCASTLDANAIADVVKDFGFDGVDIDYEPYDHAKCTSTGNSIQCNTDGEFRGIVKAINKALNGANGGPQPRIYTGRYLISLAAWSVGAYGEDQWKNSPPQYQMTGLMLNLLKSPEASMIDMLNVMSYNTGDIPTEYNPQDALAAYRHYFRGKVVMGVSVPPEVGGQKQNVYTLQKVENQLTSAVHNNRADGIMLWSLQKQPHGTPNKDNPNAQMIAQTACNILSLSNCTSPLFSS